MKTYLKNIYWLKLFLHSGFFMQRTTLENLNPVGWSTSFQDRREHDRKTSEFIVHDRISGLLVGFHWFCIRNPSFFEDQTNEFSSSSKRCVVVKNFPVRHFFGNKKNKCSMLIFIIISILFFFPQMYGPLHMFIFINFIFTLFHLIFWAILFLQEFYMYDMFTCSVVSNHVRCASMTSKIWVSLIKRYIKQNVFFYWK